MTLLFSWTEILTYGAIGLALLVGSVVLLIAIGWLLLRVFEGVGGIACILLTIVLIGLLIYGSIKIYQYFASEDESTPQEQSVETLSMSINTSLERSTSHQ